MVRFFKHAPMHRSLPYITLEIDPEVDFDSRRAVYFRQMRYGLFVSSHSYFVLYLSNRYPQIRMALLASVLA